MSSPYSQYVDHSMHDLRPDTERLRAMWKLLRSLSKKTRRLRRMGRDIAAEYDSMCRALDSLLNPPVDVPFSELRQIIADGLGTVPTPDELEELADDNERLLEKMREDLMGSLRWTPLRAYFELRVLRAGARTVDRLRDAALLISSVEGETGELVSFERMKSLIDV